MRVEPAYNGSEELGMKVVRLGRYRTQDVGTVLKHLLAKWEAGEIKGMAVCYKDAHNGEHISFTGNYHDDPAHALSAAMKMSRRINEIQDEIDLSPPKKR